MVASHRHTPCIWIEMDIEDREFDIRRFFREDGTLDKDIMIEEIKNDLNERHRKTFEWQKVALLDSYPSD